MAGPSLHNTQCSSPTLYTHTVYIELDGRRHTGRQRGARKEQGRMEGGGLVGARGGRERGSDNVRQGGSGSGGTEGWGGMDG